MSFKWSQTPNELLITPRSLLGCSEKLRLSLKPVGNLESAMFWGLERQAASMSISVTASKRSKFVPTASAYVCDSCLAALLRHSPVSHLGSPDKPENWRRLRLRKPFVTKRFTTTAAVPQDRGRTVGEKESSESHAPHASDNKVAKEGRRHNFKNKGLASDVAGVQRATHIARDISEQKTLQNEDYKRLVSVLYDRRNSHAVQQAHIRSTTQKLSQSAAATAVLAQFRPPKTKLKVSNRNLLNELLDSDRCDDAATSMTQGGDINLIENSKGERSLANGRSENNDNMSLTDAQSDSLSETPHHIPTGDSKKTVYGIEDVALPPVLKPRMKRFGRGISKEAAPRVREMSELELALHCNPYAHALSSSLRQCSVTGLRQPASLFVGFELHLDTSSGLPWMVPDGTQIEKPERDFVEPGDDSPFSLKSFFTRSSGKPDASQEVDDSVITRTNSDVVSSCRTGATSVQSEPFAGSLEVQNAGSRLKLPVAMAQKSRALRISGMKAYAVRSRSALSWITDNAARMSRSIPVGWRLELKNATRDLIVRQNMDGYVTKLLRYKIARHLAWLATQKGDCVLQRLRNVVTQGSSYHPEVTVFVPRTAPMTGDVQGIAAFLCLDGTVASAQACFRRSQPFKNVRKHSPETFAHTVAVYNLPQLLGSDAFSWLQTAKQAETVESDIYKESVVAVRRDPRTVKALILLWNLRQHLHLESSTVTDILLELTGEADSS